MVTTVFEHIDQSPDHIEFRIKVTVVEIYMEKIRDLLDISKVDLKIRFFILKRIEII
jgi:kinesin family member 5